MRDRAREWRYTSKIHLAPQFSLRRSHPEAQEGDGEDGEEGSNEAESVSKKVTKGKPARDKSANGSKTESGGVVLEILNGLQPDTTEQETRKRPAKAQEKT